MGPTWTLRRFAVLLLGSSSTSAAAGVGGAAGTQSADVGDLLVAGRSSDGVSWLPPAQPL